MLAMQMAWEAEQAAILAITDDAKARLAMAESAQKSGLIRKAVTLYTRVALNKDAPEQAAAARQALTALQDEARQKFDDIETRLADATSVSAPAVPAAGSKSKSAAPGSTGSKSRYHRDAIAIPGLEDDTPVAGPGEQQPAPPATGAKPDDPNAVVLSCFEEFDKLLWAYDDVPRIGPELRRRLVKLRRSPQYALVLNEPEAARLWQLGQQHEMDDQTCCAFLVYEQAVKLSPAPSAELAQKRLSALKRDKTEVAAAERCRHLRACHKTFERAERLAKVAPDKAKQLLGEVVTSAPTDSELYRVARERLNTLTTDGA